VLDERLIIQTARDPVNAVDKAGCDTIVAGVPMWELTPGSIWRNTDSGSVFICADAATGVWRNITARSYWPNVQAAGTTLAPSAAQSGSRFIVTNAASVTVTLPTLAENLVYEFLRAADEEMVIASAAGDDMVVGGDLSADSVTFTTAGQHIGAVVRVEGILVGTTPKWLVTIPTAPYSTGVLLALALAT
jgi:hypothetical protein